MNPAARSDATLITGVIAPLALEARTARPLRRDNWRIAHSGIGPARAQTAALSLLAAGAERLLVWGTAGGLVPELRPGTLVVPRLIRDGSGAEHPTDDHWRDTIRMHLPSTIPCVDSALVSVNRPAVDAADKHALAYQTGAEAVDMEAAAVAAIAAAWHVPCAALRAIADPFELTLPRCVLDARCDRLLPLELPLRLIFNPHDMPALRALARSFGAARRSLHATAQSLAQAAH
ncbi:MAG: hypothetical protein ACRETC_03720 [Gammaproteobacteria bacterium]